MAPRRRSKNPIIHLRADQLQVHPTAQRHQSEPKIARLMAKLDLDGLGVLAVVKIGEQFYIIDGQHRWTALIRHGLGEWEVRCEHHIDADDNDARASELFLELNDRLLVSAIDKFMNAVRAGWPTESGVMRVATELGLAIDRGPGDRKIRCVKQLCRVYEIDGTGAILRTALLIIIESWGAVQSALDAHIIGGLGLFAARFNGEVDQERLRRQLARYPGGADGVLGDALGLRKIRAATIPKCVGEIALAAYNQNLRRKLEW